mmetsp:Transcript_83200/g.209720  ORF Transcript_83200/g.209720 Transcript_83200/m.209720 type:complete len:368 (+) Transcript_83200:75-1178(+)
MAASRAQSSLPNGTTCGLSLMHTPWPGPHAAAAHGSNIDGTKQASLMEDLPAWAQMPRHGREDSPHAPSRMPSRTPSPMARSPRTTGGIGALRLKLSALTLGDGGFAERQDEVHTPRGQLPPVDSPPTSLAPPPPPPPPPEGDLLDRRLRALFGEGGDEGPFLPTPPAPADWGPPSLPSPPSSLATSPSAPSCCPFSSSPSSSCKSSSSPSSSRSSPSRTRSLPPKSSSCCWTSPSNRRNAGGRPGPGSVPGDDATVAEATVGTPPLPTLPATKPAPSSASVPPTLASPPNSLKLKPSPSRSVALPASLPKEAPNVAVSRRCRRKRTSGEGPSPPAVGSPDGPANPLTPVTPPPGEEAPRDGASDFP